MIPDNTAYAQGYQNVARKINAPCPHQDKDLVVVWFEGALAALDDLYDEGIESLARQKAMRDEIAKMIQKIKEL